MYLFSRAVRRISGGLKNEFELSTVIELLVFEPLGIYCTCSSSWQIKGKYHWGIWTAKATRWRWLGETKVSFILGHRVQLILAYSWARPAILAAGKGRGGMFLFLLFLHCHSISLLPCPSLSSPLLSLLSLFSLSQGLRCRFTPTQSKLITELGEMDISFMHMKTAKALIRLQQLGPLMSANKITVYCINKEQRYWWDGVGA